MKWKLVLVSILSGMFYAVTAQTNDINDIQYGVAIKTTIDLNLQHPNFNIALAVGGGAHPFDYPEAYPSIHAGILLYNRGDLVSSYKKSFFGSTSLDLFISGSLSFGFYSQNIDFNNRFVPLYYFSDFVPTPLQNPYRQSFTLGTNIIWLIQQKGGELPQRVGFTGLMIDRRVQLSTYNDGSIWARAKLGDGLDRYYTGGGMIAYHMDHKNEVSNIEFSFHKFTGHEKYAFDIANQLQIDFIPFKDNRSYYYNKNRFRLTVSSFKNNFGLHLTAHNVDRDPQDWIHFKGGNTYHPDIFSDSRGPWNELRRMGIGGFWYNTTLKFTN
jgi:hypothetical protein